MQLAGNPLHQYNYYYNIHFSDQYWPDFNEQDFLNVIDGFNNRERRYGKISEQIK